MVLSATAARLKYVLAPRYGQGDSPDPNRFDRPTLRINEKDFSTADHSIEGR